MLTTIIEEINGNTIIVRDFNTLLTLMDDHPDRKLIRKHNLKSHIRPGGPN